MRNCWTATSYAEYHRNGCTHAAYSPGCRPLGSHSRLATTPSTMPRRLHRYKTLPARAPRGRYRYKTLPARSPVGPPGTKLSQHARKRRFWPTFRTQGESFHAHANNKPRRESFVPHAGPVPVQNSPDTRPRRAIPVQNSPSTQPRRPTRYKTLPTRNPRGPTRYKTLPTRPKTPILAHFPHAGRVLYRFHHHQAEQGEKSHARAAPRGAGQALTTPGTP